MMRASSSVVSFHCTTLHVNGAYCREYEPCVLLAQSKPPQLLQREVHHLSLRSFNGFS